MLDAQSLDTLLHMLWLEIAARAPATRAELHARFEGQPELVDRALALLLADGRVQVDPRPARRASRRPAC